MKMKFMKVTKRYVLIVPVLLLIYVCLFVDIPQLFASNERTALLKPFNITRLTLIKTKQKPSSVISRNVWVIVVILTKPTIQQLHLCQVRQWTILIMGNDEHIHQWRKSGCLYHSLVDQQKLSYNSAQFIHSFSDISSRKNTAILFAMEHGADIIYDAEDTDNIFNLPETQKWCLEYSDSDIINPFKHFTQNNSTQSVIPYAISDCVPSVVSVMPNIEFINRLQFVGESHNKDSASTPGKLRFNKFAPPFTTSPFVFINFVPKTKMYIKDSFWTAAVFPDTSVEDRIIDSYWQQRLLWEINGTHIVYPSHEQFYTWHNVSVSRKVQNALNVLRNWTCAGDKSVFKCLEDLTFQMVRVKIWSTIKYKIIISWIQDLKSMNYGLPSRRNWLAYQVEKRTGKRDSPPRVNYSPSRLSNYFTELHYLYKKICPFYNSNITTTQKQTSVQFDSVLLLIVFNHPLYDHVELLHQLYSVKFENIAYCGDNAKLFMEKTKQSKYTFTFFEESVHKGVQIYKCVTTAMKIYSNTVGILMLSDDVLLNTWTLDQFPTDKAWTHQLFTLIRGQRHQWDNWVKPWGETAFNKAWEKIISEQLGSVPDLLTTDFIQFQERLSGLTNKSDGLCFGYNDVFYMPQTKYLDFIYYASKFAKHGLFLEIAIPLLVAGLNDVDDIVMLPGKYLWYDDRVKYKQFYSVNNTFIHPFKLGVELKTSTGKTFLCDQYLPHI